MRCIFARRTINLCQAATMSPQSVAVVIEGGARFKALIVPRFGDGDAGGRTGAGKTGWCFARGRNEAVFYFSCSAAQRVGTGRVSGGREHPGVGGPASGSRDRLKTPRSRGWERRPGFEVRSGWWAVFRGVMIVTGN